MARKEAQSATIQIMRYVLLGCKATRQAMNTSQGLLCQQSLLQGHAFSYKHSTEQSHPPDSCPPRAAAESDP